MRGKLLLERLQKPRARVPETEDPREPEVVTRNPEEGAISLEELPPETLRSEVNLLIFPFFALNNREVRRKRETVFRTVAVRNNSKIELVWSVSANTKYGYPGPFDREVHRTIEEIINEMPLPIRNPIRFSTYDLVKRMGKKEGGWQYRRIKTSMERIAGALIQTRGTFYHKGRKRWIDDTFHLYDRVVFKGEELPDGRIAQENLLFLSDLYLESINSRYVKPIDYKYYRSLGNAIAQRLYEILGVKFYGIYGRLPYIRYLYTTLCQLIPMAPQRYFSKAKEKLEHAHKELVQTGFIKEPVWEPAQAENDWLIYYEPGPRAIEEIERFKPKERQIDSSIQQLETEDEWLAEWRAMTPEQKAEHQLQRWLMMKEALNKKPSQEEIEAKRKELVEYYSRPDLMPQE